MNRFGPLAVVAAVVAFFGAVPAGSVHASEWAPDVSDVPYRTVGDLTLMLDVFQPHAGTGVFPAVVVVHGGWDKSTKSHYWEQGRFLAEHGFVAFVIDYRLVCDPARPPQGVPPELCGHLYPDPQDDVLGAIEWVRQHATEYGAVPTAVGILGGSAGGLLALTAATASEAGLPKPDAAVSWSGFIELWRYDLSPEPEHMERAMAKYLGCAYAECPDRWHQASSITFVSSDDPPTYLANGTAEITPLASAQTMVEELQQVGVPAFLRVREGNIHGRQYLDTVVDGAGTTVFQESVAFLRTHLGDAPGVPTISVSNATVTEGDGGTVDAAFTVTLAGTAPQPVTVDYVTVDGAAEAGTDYTAVAGSVTFGPGETSESVVVAIDGDTEPEADEDFFVVFSNPSGAILRDGRGTGVVAADDLDPPAIAGFTPVAGPVGKAVAITGSGFNQTTSVRFGGTQAVYTVVSDGRIDTRVPSGAQARPITVTTPLGSDASDTLFQVKPKVTGFSPGSGPVGASVTLTGSTFTGVTKVTFGGTRASFAVDSDSSISATVPVGAVTGRIVVTGPGGKGKSKVSFVVTGGP